MRIPKGWTAVLVAVAALAARADDKDAEKKLDTPEKCVEAFKTALAKADAKEIFHAFSPATRKTFIAKGEKELKEIRENPDEKADVAKEMGVKPEDLDTMTAEQYVSWQVEHGMKESKIDIEKMKFTFLKKEDARAVAEMDDGSDKHKLVLIKTDGEWGIDEAETQKLESAPDDDDTEKDEGDEGSGKK